MLNGLNDVAQRKVGDNPFSGSLFTLHLIAGKDRLSSQDKIAALF